MLTEDTKLRNKEVSKHGQGDVSESIVLQYVRVYEIVYLAMCIGYCYSCNRATKTIYLRSSLSWFYKVIVKTKPDLYYFLYRLQSTNIE
jgi:hypothetical protein